MDTYKIPVGAQRTFAFTFTRADDDFEATEEVPTNDVVTPTARLLDNQGAEVETYEMTPVLNSSKFWFAVTIEEPGVYFLEYLFEQDGDEKIAQRDMLVARFQEVPAPY